MSKTNQEEHKSIQIDADPLSQFHMSEDELRFELVKAQYSLRETRQVGQATGLLVLINGMELSGKGAAVTQLRQWVDPRLFNVEATIGLKPALYEPVWQAHVSKLPRHGNITAYFGNWYADLITGALTCMKHDKNKTENGEESWEYFLKEQLQVLAEFEADLKANHTKILKCWFHIDEETLQQRLKDNLKDPTWLYHMDWQDKKMVKRFNDIAKIILSQQSDWLIIDGSNDRSDEKSKNKKHHRAHNHEASVQFCHEVLHATQAALVSSQQKDSLHALGQGVVRNINAAFSWKDVPDKLTDIDDPDMDKSDYHQALAKKQVRIAELLRARNSQNNKEGKSCKNTGNNHHVIFAFEGMDAAGKGGSIKRLVSPLDPREYQIYNISAPTQIELQYPYLWRFWNRLPQFQPSMKEERLSRVAIFDRTWYGRVLVERIEGFASEAAWQRAYEEINRMERDLADKGTIIIKYWLAIDKQEQLERFEERKETPHKQFKLTDDDWRNRDKWHDYVQAAADMLALTNTKYAPWHVVATNDKRTARLAVLDHAIKQLERVVNT